MTSVTAVARPKSYRFCFQLILRVQLNRMTHWTVIILATIAVATCLTASEAISPIWMAPTNLNYSTTVDSTTFDADIWENFTANLGEWATIEVATGARGLRPLSVMDSKGIIWILGGSLDAGGTYYLTAVWNFNPKTDQYRYVWKTNNSSPFVARDAGELRVPAPSNHPGGIAYGTAAIDKDDNIWFYSYEHLGELWMFNTTSSMFVRQFGEPDSNIRPFVGANPGQPGEDVQPGITNGHCLVIDSNNNLWMLSGFNYYGVTNGVWQFNTTSFLWTFITGSIHDLNLASNTTYYGGEWLTGCEIDDNDRVWIYGGSGHGGAFGDLWTFDTRTKREWAFEYGEDTLGIGAQVVSTDYHPDNRPPAAEGPVLIDRRDGTLMLVPGGSMDGNGNFGGSNTVWQYSKSLKQWRMVYGNASAFDLPGEYTNFRAPGSSMPGYIRVAYTGGKNNGDLYLIGGSRYQDADTAPTRKDIWLIPQDQCVNNIHKCDVNADCIEEMIGYSCQCKGGFTGDGFTCVGPPVADVPVTMPVADGAPSSSNAPTTNSPSKSPSNSPSRKTSGASLISTSVVGALIIALAFINV